MHQVGGPRRPSEAGQPAQRLVLVGVRRETVQGLDPRAHVHVGPEHLEMFRSILERAAARAFCLVAHEQHRRVWIGETLHQVMQDAPAGGHPAGGNDDGSALQSIESLRLFLCATIMKITRL